ncbi:MAG: Gfo/Idh/MocA family oxidoreductase [Spirochaetes bacterium]|jgi:dihydrodiol dehydrogenase / D-xylose 1-dehydrogenase (NADP)|nr:Gfo/Idh/MocA family oxidoreductase [Spirochaetota bacterium]
MGKEKVRWGLIGPGRIAESFAQGIAHVDEAQFYAVASSNIERAREFGARYSAQKMYGSYEEMLADPEVDAVYIATPHRFHYDNIKLCLQAGKAVLCEKPITVNSKESSELFALAREKKLFLMEALWSRFLPVYDDVREWLDSSKIGRIRLINATFGVNLPYDSSDRWYNPELAGGALLDMGIYPLAVTQWILNENPESFNVEACLSDTGVDELTVAVLKYKSGVIAQMNAGFVAEASNELIIYGAKGSITIHSCFWASTQATLETDNKKLTVTRPFKASGFEYEIEAATLSILDGDLECKGISQEDTASTMKVMDEMRARIGLVYPFEK